MHLTGAPLGCQTRLAALSFLLLIGPSPGRPGGVATYVRSLIRELDGRESSRWALLPTDKAQPSRIGSRFQGGLKLARAIRRQLRESSPGLVHICCGSDASGWGLREGLLHARLSRAAGAQVLLHLHASGLPALLDARGLDALLLTRIAHEGIHLAVPSPATARLLEAAGVEGRLISVIPNGVTVPPITSAPTAAAREPLQLLVIGSIERRKGIDVLLDALEDLSTSHPGAIRITAIGPPATEAEELDRWRRRGADLGLQFEGPIPAEQVARRLVASDGLVLPSRAECLPFVLLEAMAASRPVLAASTGGIPDLLEGGAGDLVDPGDPAALADALRVWLDRPEHRHQLAAAGRQRVQQQYSTQTSMDATWAAWAKSLGTDADAAEGLIFGDDQE